MDKQFKAKHLNGTNTKLLNNARQYTDMFTKIVRSWGEQWIKVALRAHESPERWS
jgi:hypothetical protein